MVNEDKKTEWRVQVEGHLLDGINIMEVTQGWVWTYIPEWDGHRIDDDETVYTSFNQCQNAVLQKMRNSPKLKYAKNSATTGNQYTNHSI